MSMCSGEEGREPEDEDEASEWARLCSGTYSARCAGDVDVAVELGASGEGEGERRVGMARGDDIGGCC